LPKRGIIKDNSKARTNKMADIPINTGTMRASDQRASQRRLVGISFPFRKENGEFPARVRDADCVQNDLLTLFNTVFRNRVMRPLLGHSANNLVFDSIDGTLVARLQRIIRQTIVNNENRIKIISITMSRSGTKITPKCTYVVQGIRETVELPTIDTSK